MNERVELPAVPAWAAVLPFLFSSRSRDDQDLIVSSALGSAAAAMAADSERRDSRSGICFLIAELASQFERRTGGNSGWIPVTRNELARAARINLTKVKRILGFLLLSRVIEIGTEGVRVTDWRRLCDLAAYDRRWLATPMPKDEDLDALPRQEKEQPPTELTSAGDPASFV